MSWFSVGFEEAERMSQPSVRSSNKNFWTKPDESAVVRFLSPAKNTVNIKRAFIPGAKGQKYYTSPMVDPDPFVEAGYNLQSTFIWKILDRRVLEFTNKNGQDMKVGPRVLYFAVGQRDRKALLAFEAQMLQDYNDQLKEDGKPLMTAEEYNISSYDVRISKPKGGAWQFIALRGGQPKALSAADKKLVEEGDFSLEEELKPLPLAYIHTMLQSLGAQAAAASTETVEYSYDTEDTAPTFFNS